MRHSVAAILSAILIISADAFVPSSVHNGVQRATTDLKFGIPTFQPKKKDEDETESNEDLLPKKTVGLSGVLQLITAGMGAPFLGEFEGVDKESGKLMFSLEANNLVDEEGKSKQTQMPYFENGWVDPEDEKRAQEGFKFPWQK